MAYALPDMVGWTSSQVSNWLAYDAPGEWPEAYHQGHIIAHVTKHIEVALEELIDGPKQLLIPGLQALKSNLNLMNF